mmetsp:Transcript_48716/g.87765  ORF Transcript_48716/g.87765 Transcript_48716/m.87765 type:complete len:111 (-) Transcript_48716:2295-2627(-)
MKCCYQRARLSFESTAALPFRRLVNQNTNDHRTAGIIQRGESEHGPAKRSYSLLGRLPCMLLLAFSMLILFFASAVTPAGTGFRATSYSKVLCVRRESAAFQIANPIIAQ